MRDEATERVTMVTFVDMINEIGGSGDYKERKKELRREMLTVSQVMGRFRSRA